MRSLRNGNFIKWFYFGMHIKRWLLLLLFGVAMGGLGFAYILREAYVSYTFPSFVHYLTIQFLPRYVRGVLFIGGAPGVVLVAAWKLNPSPPPALLPPGPTGETRRVLAVRGQILPSTLANVTLSARTDDEETIHGESNITERGSRIQEVYLHPEKAQANPDTIRAILGADVIVAGPGSLYTSVLPNLLVQGIRQALAVSPAPQH